jgi:hypothetical protein
MMLFWILGYCEPLFGQQLIDSLFVGNIQEPTYSFGKGPTILLDEAHHNGMQLNTGFKPLSNVLIKDGFRIKTISSTITENALKNVNILVIIDALAEQNVDHWELPTPSPFTEEEIEIIKHWVFDGGSLLLVADHMPFAGASSKLAKQFNVDFINGFAIDTLEWDINKFNRTDNSLKDHSITRGRDSSETINEISTYFGQGFSTTNKNLKPIMVFQDENMISYQPKKAWRFNEDTTTVLAKGLLQGLAGEFGQGRIVVLGDSSLMSAHLIGKKARPIGINSVETKDNFQFVLNIFHWLSRLLN